MKIKEVHFRYLDEDYFISLPEEDFQFVSVRFVLNFIVVVIEFIIFIFEIFN